MPRQEVVGRVGQAMLVVVPVQNSRAAAGGDQAAQAAAALHALHAHCPALSMQGHGVDFSGAAAAPCGGMVGAAFCCCRCCLAYPCQRVCLLTV